MEAAVRLLRVIPYDLQMEVPKYGIQLSLVISEVGRFAAKEMSATIPYGTEEHS